MHERLYAVLPFLGAGGLITIGVGLIWHTFVRHAEAKNDTVIRDLKAEILAKSGEIKHLKNELRRFGYRADGL